MKRYFVFRVNYDDAHDWIMDEFENKSLLRQGWGKRNFQLIDQKKEKVDRDVWKINYQQVWNDSDDEVNKRYDILSRMLDIAEGDMIIVPKTRDWHTFTICEANGGYFYDSEHETLWDDFKHVIPIKSFKRFNYKSYAEATQISAKFKAYQSAINNVWQQSTIESIESLFKKESSDHAKTIQKLTDELIGIAIRPITEKLLDIDPISFEDIIVKCLESRGYEIISRRKYDGKGADVDIIASFSLPYFSDFIDQSPTLFIQIKKKKGNDWNDVEGVDQLIKSGKDCINPIKILMNTSDTFTPEAKELAVMHGITVLHGVKVIDFVFKSPINSMA